MNIIISFSLALTARNAKFQFNYYKIERTEQLHTWDMTKRWYSLFSIVSFIVLFTFQSYQIYIHIKNWSYRAFCCISRSRYTALNLPVWLPWNQLNTNKKKCTSCLMCVCCGNPHIMGPSVYKKKQPEFAKQQQWNQGSSHMGTGYKDWRPKSSVFTVTNYQ